MDNVMLKNSLIAVVMTAVCHVASAAPVASADKDAAAHNLYLQAAAAVRADSPAATSMEYPSAPPFGAEWDRVAKESWEKNAAVFPLVRKARTAEKAQWPHSAELLPRLNACRNLANVVGDAALYQHLQGNDREAVELVRDLFGLSDSLRTDLGPDDIVRLLVGIGIDALDVYRLMIITSDVRLSDDPADAKALQTRDANRLMTELLDEKSSSAGILKKMLADNPKAIDAIHPPDAARALEQANRCDAERAFAAMSLACHVYRHETGRWPRTIEELATRLPAPVPIDPWGDGKQAVGYVLVPGGNPDVGERPLVYSRCESKDGLFYRIDAAQYCFYGDDGSDRPPGQRKHGGQFRDVTNWHPKTGPDAAAGPTTRPLP
jgi:hypothetical protein